LLDRQSKTNRICRIWHKPNSTTCILPTWLHLYRQESLL